MILNNAKVYASLQALIDGAKSNNFSLAVFKPKRILGFIWEAEAREWDQSKVDEMRERSRQGVLFEEDAWRLTFRLIAKLPYSFSYRFEDGDGRVSELQILDWETGQLFWNCMRQNGNGEQTALEMVKAKYLDEFTKKDLHFFLGTTQQFHSWAINPWVIVGVFPIPDELQASLF